MGETEFTRQPEHHRREWPSLRVSVSRTYASGRSQRNERGGALAMPGSVAEEDFRAFGALKI
jgi:hypothetical protein